MESEKLKPSGKDKVYGKYKELAAKYGDLCLQIQELSSQKQKLEDQITALEAATPLFWELDSDLKKYLEAHKPPGDQL